MKRKCDKCENEATVHEVTIRDGAKVEKHLCESCARSEGIVVQPHAPINELITKFVMSHTGQAGKAQRTAECPECGLRFQDFRQQGLLGCAACYRAFESQLGPLIERAQDGGASHLGKAPKGGGGRQDRERRIMTLRKQLSDAIAAEEYERAASLRDQLMNAEKKGDPPRATKVTPQTPGVGGAGGEHAS